MQQKLRVKLAKKFAKQIYPLMDVERIERTGQMWPRGTLRKRRVRKVFEAQWLREVQGRVFTRILCLDIVSRLLEMIGVQPTRPPDQSLNQWRKSQAVRFHTLCRHAKKQRYAAWLQTFRA